VDSSIVTRSLVGPSFFGTFEWVCPLFMSRLDGTGRFDPPPLPALFKSDGLGGVGVSAWKPFHFFFDWEEGAFSGQGNRGFVF